MDSYDLRNTTDRPLFLQSKKLFVILVTVTNCDIKNEIAGRRFQFTRCKICKLKSLHYTTEHEIFGNDHFFLIIFILITFLA